MVRNSRRESRDSDAENPFNTEGPTARQPTDQPKIQVIEHLKPRLALAARMYDIRCSSIKQLGLNRSHYHTLHVFVIMVVQGDVGYRFTCMHW